MTDMDYIGIIQSKRDGQVLTAEEVGGLIDGYMSGEVADYQMAAWLMAAFLEGLDLGETTALTEAMIASGEVIDLTSLGRKVLDKHSTGGVGDKVTMVLAPLIASCGAVFGKMSGRGLGHTGGTVDKLESIPGFKTTISPDDFLTQLKETGVCVAGQSPSLVPADDRLYQLRDLTATVDSNALTAASIMSKKIAAGASSVVLDVKMGRGAFFKNRGQASGVAHLMQELGTAHGLKVAVVITAMEQPLGRAVGNSLEVLEAVKTLRGQGPDDLQAVVTALASALLSRGDLGWDAKRSAAEASRRLRDGSALEKFRQWIEAQGGDAGFIDDPGLLPLARQRLDLRAAGEGFVQGVDALKVGEVVLGLGAGRRKKDEEVDHSVGVTLNAKVGDKVAAGGILATVYARDATQAGEAAAGMESAYTFSSSRTGVPDPIIAGADGDEPVRPA